MCKIITSLAVLICALAVANNYPQDKTNNYWINIDKDLLYNLTIVQNQDGTIEKGLLSGMRGDSIYLTQNNDKKKAIALYNIASITIYDGRRSDRVFTYGLLIGTYACNWFFYTEKNTKEKYLSYDEIGILAIVNLIFSTLGGSIGYLIDRSLVKEKQTFLFSENEKDKKSDIESLKKFLSTEKQKGKLYVSLDMSQVSTRLSSLSDNNNQSVSDNNVHSFNLLRKISLTYMFLPNLELGGTICWFGEPEINYFNGYSTDFYDYKTFNINESYHAIGYFIIANYHPLRAIIPSNFEFLIGGGVGVSNIDFKDTYSSDESNYYINYSSTHVENTKNINGNKLSYIFMSRFNFNIYPELYLSLQGDYVFVPGYKIPAITELSLKERNLGNFSIGVGIGLNF